MRQGQVDMLNDINDYIDVSKYPSGSGGSFVMAMFMKAHATILGEGNEHFLFVCDNNMLVEQMQQIIRGIFKDYIVSESINAKIKKTTLSNATTIHFATVFSVNRLPTIPAVYDKIFFQVYHPRNLSNLDLLHIYSQMILPDSPKSMAEEFLNVGFGLPESLIRDKLHT